MAATVSIVDQADEPTPALDAATIDQLVRTHLPLVGHIVRETLARVPSYVSRDDLVSAGMYALAVSARSFDPDRGVPFGRFAAIRIRGALTDELRSMDWASRAVRGRARSIESVRSELAATLGRGATRDEVAQALGISPAEVDSADADVQRASVLSLQSLDTEDGAALLPSAGGTPEATIMLREQIGYLRDAIAELPERLRTVVEQYFFEQRKMADIAADFGVTESRVSQMRGEALTLLRAAVRGMDEPAGEAAAPAPASRTSRRQAAAQATYVATVATRSTLAGRLAQTTVSGEPLPLRDAG
jgi:RNA polymerase sigma factor for flagellar operon FliA